MTRPGQFSLATMFRVIAFMAIALTLGKALSAIGLNRVNDAIYSPPEWLIASMRPAPWLWLLLGFVALYGGPPAISALNDLKDYHSKGLRMYAFAGVLYAIYVTAGPLCAHWIWGTQNATTTLTVLYFIPVGLRILTMVGVVTSIVESARRRSLQQLVVSLATLTLLFFVYMGVGAIRHLRT